jgi:hypothetical protein
MPLSNELVVAYSDYLKNLDDAGFFVESMAKPFHSRPAGSEVYRRLMDQSTGRRKGFAAKYLGEFGPLSPETVETLHAYLHSFNRDEVSAAVLVLDYAKGKYPAQLAIDLDHLLQTEILSEAARTKARSILNEWKTTNRTAHSQSVSLDCKKRFGQLSH